MNIFENNCSNNSGEINKKFAIRILKQTNYYIYYELCNISTTKYTDGFLCPSCFGKVIKVSGFFKHAPNQCKGCNFYNSNKYISISLKQEKPLDEIIHTINYESNLSNNTQKISWFKYIIISLFDVIYNLLEYN